jgi:antirestriction protein ArdC
MSEQGQQRSDGKASLYQDVTDRIIAELERGCVPWVRPWGAAKAGLGLPSNGATGRRYSGVNILILWGAVIEKGFRSQQWLTFRQALTLGGHVRKGERGTTVCFADRFIPKGEIERAQQEGGEPEAVPFLKRFTVFNVAQCEGLPENVAGAPMLPERETMPHAEALIAATGADFRIGGDRAFYVPAADYIQVPPQPAFFEQINYYRTCFHELGHYAEVRIMLHGRDWRLNRCRPAMRYSA